MLVPLFFCASVSPRLCAAAPRCAQRTRGSRQADRGHEQATPHCQRACQLQHHECGSAISCCRL
eukprot:6035231-Alexandrium_andersonii.AAC.1